MNGTMHGRSEGKRGRRKRGKEEASGGEREQRREVEEQLREDHRRKGDREKGKLQGRYPGGHWPIYNIQCTKLPTTRPLPLRHWF